MNFLARAGGVALAVAGLLTFALGVGWALLAVIGAGGALVAPTTDQGEPGGSPLAAMVFLLGAAPGIGIAISGLVTAGLGAGLYLLANIELHLRRLPASEQPDQTSSADSLPISPRLPRARRRLRKRSDPINRFMLALGGALVLAVLAVIGYGFLLERRNDARDRERAAEWERLRHPDQLPGEDGR